MLLRGRQSYQGEERAALEGLAEQQGPVPAAVTVSLRRVGGLASRSRGEHLADSATLTAPIPEVAWHGMEVWTLEGLSPPGAGFCLLRTLIPSLRLVSVPGLSDPGWTWGLPHLTLRKGLRGRAAYEESGAVGLTGMTTIPPCAWGLRCARASSVAVPSYLRTCTQSDGTVAGTATLHLLLPA